MLWIEMKAEVEGQPAGLAAAARLPKADARGGFLFVDELMVLPAYRRQGVARALLEYIMHLQKFQYHLMKRDVNELHRIMTSANHIRKVLEGLDVKPKPETLIESNT